MVGPRRPRPRETLHTDGCWREGGALLVQTALFLHDRCGLTQ
jgi:hypothetical protein